MLIHFHQLFHPDVAAEYLLGISGFICPAGISTGLGSTIKTAMQVEIYGKKQLGKIRSYFSTILVFSTALGPPAFGFLVDSNYAFKTVMAISPGGVFVIIILSSG